jgi:energy-coupling factor transporter ATP-binding protein EcfA2
MEMTQRILIMGLPGAGKTHMASSLKQLLEREGKTVSWFNADKIRKQFDDWDFSEAGRIRQSKRMSDLADTCGTDYAMCDFVAPLVEMRNNFKADWTIWMDTIREGRYADTNAIFVDPEVYDFRITEQAAEKWADFVSDHILYNRRRPVFDWKKESTLLLGRYQPWHNGHRALFERALAKTGQVIIQVRDCQGWNDSNPFDFEKVVKFIKQDLDPVYQGRYAVMLVPNITNITYGRDVGYKIEQEVFDDSIHSISATNIRKAMGLK